MDSLDVAVKNARGKDSVSSQSESSAQGQETASAKLNTSATAAYLNMLSRERGLLSEGLSRSLNSVQSTLNEYVKNPQTLENVPNDEQTSTAAPYRKLSEQVISRDPQLQEKVAQNLSTAQRLVRSRDAASTLSKSLAGLPQALQEGTAAGKALSRFICESLVDLTDHQTMGAGLERDLAVRNVYVPKEPLGQRSKQATNRALATSIAYVESNQPKVLANLPPQTDAAENTHDKPGITTPQIMTRYLRQALNEFPDDTTYLDIFKQNRGHNIEEPYQDKISKDTAERIHRLISRAAETARKGNLIPGQSQVSSPAGDNATTQSEIARMTHSAQDSLHSSGAKEDARTLSLSELSARAAKLQQQFREERQKLASEGKLPNPAAYPKSVAGDQVSPATDSRNADRTVTSPTAHKSEIAPPSESVSAQSTETKEVKTALKEQTGHPNVSSDTALKALNSSSVSISYKAVQSSVYGAVSLTPGMTVPVSDFTASSIADSSQLQDLTTPRTLNQVLAEQQKFNSEKQTKAALEQPKTTADTQQNTNVPEVEQKTVSENINTLTADEIAALKELAHSAATLQKTVAAQTSQNTVQSPVKNEIPAEHNEVSASPEAEVLDPASVLSEEESDALVEAEQQITVKKQLSSDSDGQIQNTAVSAAATTAAPSVSPEEGAEALQEATAKSSQQKISVAEQAYAESAAQSARREVLTAQSSRSGTDSTVRQAEQSTPISSAGVKTAETVQTTDAGTISDLSRQSRTAALPADEMVSSGIQSKDAASISVKTAPAPDTESAAPTQTADLGAAGDTADTQAAVNAETGTVAVGVSQTVTGTLATQIPAAETPAPDTASGTRELNRIYAESLSGEKHAEASAAGDGEISAKNDKVTDSTPAGSAMQKDSSFNLGQSVMSGTVPLNELDDSDTPEDIKNRTLNEKADNPGKQITGTINTAAEHSEEMMVPKMNTPLAAPGAASVTQGGSAPVPEQSVIEDLQPIKENGLFHKIASIFSKKTENSSVTAEKTATQAIAGSGNALMNLKGNPLDSLIYELKSQIETPDIPDRLKEEARSFIRQLTDPVADLASVSNWLNFVTGPMSPSSSQALGLHQWAFLLLCIRFSHLGKSVDKFLSRVKGENLKDEIADLSLKLSSRKEDLNEILEETLDQVDRLQKFRENIEANQLVARYIPLPPSYEGGREGGMSIHKEEEADGQKSWHLTFNFDLPGLGPIEIKAVAKLPELRLSVVTETLSGLQKVQECMPLLTKQLQEAGITTRTANARLGRITPQEQAQTVAGSDTDEESSGLSIKI
ncbi:MAG: flagellar hook-length control protein FliK [Succinivibrio sp.]|nr:flagellar hook-length control protein FliK [Succinivibrio sp.]